MEYSDYGIKYNGNNEYIMYRFLKNGTEDAATFFISVSSFEGKIYPNYKGYGLGYIIKCFIDDLSSKK